MSRCKLQVQFDQEVDRAPWLARRWTSGNARTAGSCFNLTRYGASSRRSDASYANGNFSASGSRKKSKGLIHRHLGDQIRPRSAIPASDPETRRGRGSCLRILLPVDEMCRRLDLQRVGEYSRPAMGRRSQPHGLRPDFDKPVVPVVGDVVECDVYRHSASIDGHASRNRRTRMAAGSNEAAPIRGRAADFSRR